jgi:hypothetical protein
LAEGLQHSAIGNQTPAARAFTSGHAPGIQIGFVSFHPETSAQTKGNSMVNDTSSRHTFYPAGVVVLAIILGGSPPATAQQQPSGTERPVLSPVGPAISGEHPSTTPSEVPMQRSPGISLDLTAVELGKLSQQIATLTAQVESLRGQVEYLDQQRQVMLNSLNGDNERLSQLSATQQATMEAVTALRAEYSTHGHIVNGIVANGCIALPMVGIPKCAVLLKGGSAERYTGTPVRAADAH